MPISRLEKHFEQLEYLHFTFRKSSFFLKKKHVLFQPKSKRAVRLFPISPQAWTPRNLVAIMPLHPPDYPVPHLSSHQFKHPLTSSLALTCPHLPSLAYPGTFIHRHRDHDLGPQHHPCHKPPTLLLISSARCPAAPSLLPPPIMSTKGVRSSL